MSYPSRIAWWFTRVRTEIEAKEGGLAEATFNVAVVLKPWKQLCPELGTGRVSPVSPPSPPLDSNSSRKVNAAAGGRRDRHGGAHVRINYRRVAPKEKTT